ncbi:MAG: bifunctional folylpolyglutamate synthase/dihydrofolate synthase [Alphaproteobacteria bacterium]|nr:bifunctional folylpolyglutamate synthase/dihydrofolate synthase [Alphaproteobacteria bacterium]
MSNTSEQIIERFRTSYGKDIDLSLRPAYHDLLEKLGNPQNKLPPVFHVAGTNGKGSTCAFLRAILEAAGYKVHLYTSPHLVTIYERIRIAGKLIEEEELAALLAKAESLAIPHGVSYFEAWTAAAFDAFAKHPADFTILETGLGGRLDATNVIDKPLASIIARLSYDHREYLGETIEKIAREKAGIMREGVPCFTSYQPEPGALRALRDAAANIHAPLLTERENWIAEETPSGFRFTDSTRTLDLPHPALLGRHQIQNAALAIAALSALPQPLPEEAYAKGLQTVEWPARLQRLQGGRLDALAPRGAEVWLDGGHNDSAGEALAGQIERWKEEDGATPRPLHIVLGMLTTKAPSEFLSPFAKNISRLQTVPVPNEPLSFSAEALAREAQSIGLTFAQASPNVREALKTLSQEPAATRPPRILICGSLYLAGTVLADQNPESPIEPSEKKS